MNRVDALAAAENLVDRLDPKKNERGYDRNTADLSARISAMLRVADWLCASPGEEGDEVDDKAY
jgi:hypothetical protein